MFIKRFILILICVPFALAVVVIDGYAGAKGDRDRVVVDMAGRSVSIPNVVHRVAVLGPFPTCLNTFVLALGKGGTIVNGPRDGEQSHRNGCCRFQPVFAPQLYTRPCLETADRSLNRETLILLRPDVVITGIRRYVDHIERIGIPVVYIGFEARGDKNKEIMALLGKVYNEEHQANRYGEYFDSVIHRIRTGISDIPEKDKTRVLYCNFKMMNQSSLTADWWIEQAGGISLRKEGPIKSGIRSLSPEHVLLWNPDVWIVPVPDEIDMVYRDPRFKNVSAVKNRRVYSVPVGSVRWSHPTSEQPLGVLWAAKLLYPERFGNVNIEAEVRRFYLTFFRYHLSDKEIKEMLTGNKQ